MASQNAWRITRAGIIFIIVVLLLGVATYAGIYFLKERGEQARQDEASKIARENLDDETKGPDVIAEDKTDDKQDDNGGTAGGATSNDDEDTTNGTGTVTDGGTKNDDKIVDSTNLPQTGPELYGLIAVIAMTFAGTAFVTSRRTVRRRA